MNKQQKENKFLLQIGLQVYSFLDSVTATLFRIGLLLGLLPVFLIFIVPMYLIRLLVVFLSKIVRPDLVAVLGTRDIVYGVDDINTAPKSSVVITGVFKGLVKKEFFIENVSKTVTKKLPGLDSLMYPELKR